MNKPDQSGERALAAHYAEMSDEEQLELGGIRLQVTKEDLETAESILSEPVRERLPVDGEEDY
jgi:hypothetical protein